MAISHVTTNYSLGTADDVVLVNSTSGPITLTLPADHVAGRRFVIKDKGVAAATNNITIHPQGTDTIDGKPNFVMNVNRQAVIIHSDGTNWFVL